MYPLRKKTIWQQEDGKPKNSGHDRKSVSKANRFWH
jgi:hypothetical protein